MPQIEVTFDIDANGILKVTAQDKATGRAQHITITASTGLSDAEVDKMRKDAQAHAEEDRKRKELIEVRNNADNTAYAAEKALRDFGEKVPADVKSEVEVKVAEVKKAVQGEDIAAIKSATEALGQVIQKIGASVYQQGPNAAGGGTDQAEPKNPNPESGPDVVEGEVKE